MTNSQAWQPWRNDEELAKKDDDHRHGAKRGPSQWTAARFPRPALVLRIVAYLFVGAAIVVVLLHATRHDGDSNDTPSHGPSHGDGFIPALSNSRPDGAAPRQHEPRPPLLKPPKAPVPYPYAEKGSSRTQAVDQGRDYNGPVTQPKLIDSLRTVTAVSPGSVKNRNVLFAAASLQSASTLLPLACQMAAERQSQVHFVFVGRDGIPLKELLKINGIDSTCPLTMHGRDIFVFARCRC